jgi:hypothetical protein
MYVMHTIMRHRIWGGARLGHRRNLSIFAKKKWARGAL